MTDHLRQIVCPRGSYFVVELTAKELSATIEAFNVADEVVDGRPPLKNNSPVLEFSGGTRYRNVNGAGTTAWRKFVEAEGRGPTRREEAAS